MIASHISVPCRPGRWASRCGPAVAAANGEPIEPSLRQGFATIATIELTRGLAERRAADLVGAIVGLVPVREPQRVRNIEHVAGVLALPREEADLASVRQHGVDDRTRTRQRNAELRIAAARGAVEAVDDLQVAVRGAGRSPHAGARIRVRREPAEQGSGRRRAAGRLVMGVP